MKSKEVISRKYKLHENIIYVLLVIGKYSNGVFILEIIIKTPVWHSIMAVQIYSHYTVYTSIYTSYTHTHTHTHTYTTYNLQYTL